MVLIVFHNILVKIVLQNTFDFCARTYRIVTKAMNFLLVGKDLDLRFVGRVPINKRVYNKLIIDLIFIKR